MATIYLWKPKLRRGQVGHLSLQLEDGPYISFWPQKGEKDWILLKKASGLKQTLQEDIEAEKRGPDKKLDIPDQFLNAEEIKKDLENRTVTDSVVSFADLGYTLQLFSEENEMGYEELSAQLYEANSKINLLEPEVISILLKEYLEEDGQEEEGLEEYEDDEVDGGRRAFTDGFPKYNLFRCNCAQFIYKLLKKHTQLWTLMEKGKVKVWTPNQVFCKLEESLNEINKTF